jgi:phenylacetate-CoA ligase
MAIYGAQEFGRFAFECEEHSGYHIVTDNVAVEFVNGKESMNFGDNGEVIITDLNNNIMPLIRYKLGDIAIPLKKTCCCGRGLPLIKEIEGREDDYLILPSGRRISPRNINVLEDIPGISAYRTIQEAKDRFVVKLVKGYEFSEKTIQVVKQRIEMGVLGEKVEVSVELVTELPKERTGKMRAVLSNCRLES